MEGKHVRKQRNLKRVSEPHRLEDELWVAVYERIYPPWCGKARRRKPTLQHENDPGAVHIARRA
jgi:hypothetical protein